MAGSPFNAILACVHLIEIYTNAYECIKLQCSDIDLEVSKASSRSAKGELSFSFCNPQAAQLGDWVGEVSAHKRKVLKCVSAF